MESGISHKFSRDGMGWPRMQGELFDPATVGLPEQIRAEGKDVARKTIVYVAGPMTGIKDYNYPAFHEAANFLRKLDYEVLNPAEHCGGATDRPYREYIKESMADVCESDMLVLLPGFENSKGATLELQLARTIGLEVAVLLDGYNLMRGEWANMWVNARMRSTPLLEVMKPDPKIEAYKTAVPTNETICQEADRLVSSDRQKDYGHPITDFTRTGRMWGAILGIPDVAPQNVGLCMAALKLSREVNKHKRDNLVDACGYVKTVDLVEQRLAEPDPF